MQYFYQQISEQISHYLPEYFYHRHSSSNYQEIVGQLIREANSYLVQGNPLAVVKFIEASKYYKVLGNIEQYIYCLNKASLFYRKNNDLKAILILEEIIIVYTKIGEFDKSAKISKDIAELYYKNDEMLRAIEYYNKSIYLFQINNKYISVINELYTNIAVIYSINLLKYDIASHYFEIAGLNSRHDVESLCRSLLCLLVMKDLSLVKKKIDQYSNVSAIFSYSRQKKLIVEMLESFIRISQNDSTEADNRISFLSCIRYYSAIDFTDSIDDWIEKIFEVLKLTI